MSYKLFALLFISLCATQVSAQSAIEKPSTLPITVNAKGNNKTLIFYLTGDGGMNSFSTKLIATLTNQNYKVVTLDSKKYFWEEKSPDRIGRELSPAIDYYLKQTKTTEFALLGYSFGADAGIFLASNLSSSPSKDLKGLILLSPSMATDLEVKVSDLIGFGDNATGKYKTLPALKKVAKPVFCLAGADENSAFYNSLVTSKTISKKLIAGSHRYDNNVSLVANTITDALASF